MSSTVLRDLRPIYGRHQTFAPRYTWFKAAYDLVACHTRDDDGNCRENGSAFTHQLAHRHLGVGKNQARAMRYWAEAGQVLREDEQDKSRLPVLRTTNFGRFLLDDDHGHDPYLEATESWWLLHWQFVSPRSMAPAWWVAFHTFQPATFTADTLHEHVLASLNGAGHDPAESVLRRDISALVRTYAGTDGGSREKVDDQIDSPFTRLGLMRHGPDGLRFSIGPKAGLAPEVVGFALTDFMAGQQSDSDRILIGTAALEAGGPGRAFKITERELSQTLDALAGRYPELVLLDRSASAEQFVLLDEPQQVATSLLRGMYDQVGAAVPHPPKGGWQALPHSATQTAPDVAPGAA